MNQTEQMQQMREALRLLQEIHPGNMTPMAEENWKATTVLLQQALAAEPAPLVRLTQIERDRIAISCQSTQQVISATIDAMIAKNGGKP